MKKFLMGTKVGMTQIFADNGDVVPVTLIKVEPNVVVQVKTTEKDGYQAVQLGVGHTRKASKPQKGHFKNLGNFKTVKEFKAVTLNDQDLNVGDKIDVSAFAVGDKVKVTGTSKGKGFQGVVKRHGFRGMPASHGAHSVLRHAGSIGQRFPQHTLKGMRMAGHMGDAKHSVRGLTVMSIDIENGIIAVKGAVPGNNGSPVTVVSK
ncbi:50S ribosomal protein L3 [Candidatus Parcubacteria bacterium]|nr:50S ribosomal protein L3 [Candidatus Parcubacteria bacterium]